MTKHEKNLRDVKPAAKMVVDFSDVKKVFDKIFKEEKKKKPMTIILPKHLKTADRKDILEYLANKIQYHRVMSEHYKNARQVVEVNGNYTFEDDQEFEKP